MISELVAELNCVRDGQQGENDPDFDDFVSSAKRPKRIKGRSDQCFCALKSDEEIAKII